MRMMAGHDVVILGIIVEVIVLLTQLMRMALGGIAMSIGALGSMSVIVMGVMGLGLYAQPIGIMARPTVLTIEGHGDEAGHVEGGAEGPQHAQDPGHQV